MKIALEISGEVRTFNHPLVRDSWTKYATDLKADLFISVWEHRGISFYSRNFSLAERQEAIQDLNLGVLQAYSNVKDLEIEDYNQWFDALSDDFANFLTQHKECSSSAPQLYKIWRASLLRRRYEEKHGKYDIVIRMRPDFLFINSFDFSNFKKNTIFHINFGTPGAYFPQRIYDIMFYGGSDEMTKICDAWTQYVKIFFDPFQNGLNPKDACRLLYIQTQKQGLNIENVSHRVGDIYRDGTLESFKIGLAGWGLTP